MRVHAFEFEDAPWLPSVLRDGITDFLRIASETLGLFHPTASVLHDLAVETGAHQFVDLCAGAGGPMLDLRRRIARDFGLNLPLVLTDLYPNHAAFRAAQNLDQETIQIRLDPVDACDVPADLPGVRTLFNALHHLPPRQVDALLADAAAKAQPIAIFEFVDRSPIALASIFATPALVYLLTPKMKSRSWLRLLLTYPVPILPALVWWDGIASCLRAYSDAELDAICAPHRNGQYDFRLGHVHAPYLGAPIRYLLGVPVPKAPPAEAHPAVWV